MYKLHRNLHPHNMKELTITKSITPRDREINMYLRDIDKKPLLSTEEEVELTKRIKAGDEKALKKMAEANLRFVVSVAKQYQNQGLALSDLINEGNLGLMKAAKRYDETRGFKFISYAVWWIRQSIIQAITQQSRTVRLPNNILSKMNKLRKGISKLEQRDEIFSDDELAYELEMTRGTIDELRSFDKKTFSLDQPINSTENEESTLLGILENEEGAPDKPLLYKSLKSIIEKELQRIPGEERRVLKLHLGLDGNDPHTFDQIGSIINRSRERVRQLYQLGIKRLRKSKSAKKMLREFL